MSESRDDAHRRLQQRTEELQEEHESLGLDRKRFNKGEHDRHAADLALHKIELEQHQNTPPGPTIARD